MATISNKARCAAAAKAASSSHQPQPQQQQQLQQKQLQIYVFETEPEALARHMLLLMVLFDDSLTARERAEMFLELHGNVLLRQRTADWACEWWLCKLLNCLTWPHSAQPQRRTSPCARLGVSKTASAKPPETGQQMQGSSLRYMRICSELCHSGPAPAGTPC